MDALLSQPAHETFEVVYLDTKAIRFAYDGENLTFANSDGVFYPRVTLRRCFPLSADTTFILVRVPEADCENERARMHPSQELGIIAQVDDLDPASKEAVLRELRLFYFVPRIQRIVKIREEFGFLYWTVETDRGGKDFIMRDSIIGQVRQVSPGRWLVIDINQTRYEIHDFEKLDKTSQELLGKYLLL